MVTKKKSDKKFSFDCVIKGCVHMIKTSSFFNYYLDVELDLKDLHHRMNQHLTKYFRAKISSMIYCYTQNERKNQPVYLPAPPY